MKNDNQKVFSESIDKLSDNGKRYYFTEGFNLLRIPFIQALVNWNLFPYIFQFLILVFFLFFIFSGWNLYAPDGFNDKLFAKLNIVNLSVWGIWWPLMVILAVFGGRIWCMVCPLEFVSNLTERLGRVIGIKQLSINKLVRTGALIVFLYALIQLLVAVVHLHRVPMYTSIFLVALLLVSAVVGLLYKDRAFCIGFCPIGILLNAYSRTGMIAVKADNTASCSDCNGKDCIASCNRTNLDKRSCPSLLNPPKLNSNKDCLVCGQCIKSCSPDNMQLLFRKPYSECDIRENEASWSLTIFIILLSGFVTYELTTEWKAAKEIFLFVPTFVSDMLNVKSIDGFIKGIWTLGVFPFLLWVILGGINVLAKGTKSLFESWRKLALPIVIIISAGHIIKALAKLNSWAGYLPTAISDPLAIKSVPEVQANLFLIPTTFVSPLFISLIGIGLLTISLFYADKLDPNKEINNSLIPKLLFTGFYIFLTIGIGL